MVSKVFPAAELPETTLAFARRIAKLPTMAALLIKESVNQTHGQHGLLQRAEACFTLHQLNHAHWAEVNDDGFPLAKEDAGVPNWRTAPAVVPALKGMVRAPEPA